ncbi:MAG TPA: enoyl-CoA hydratase [Sphingobacteriaceae bacterium]|nr:enoyl-CoA hydratase [Sphingobacteriaceae bacterium]
MDYKNLLFEIKDQVLTLTINREEKLNALNRETLKELHSALTETLQNKSVRGVIITGRGSKAFVAGADIAEFSNFSPDEGRQLASEGHKVFDLIENYEKPVIAAINGYALGGGLELAMACHLSIASDIAKMGLPEMKLGLIPGYGGTQRLTRVVGKNKALEMILTAETISAEEALQKGLVNHVVPPGELMNKANELMQKILNGSSAAMASAIRAVNGAFNRSGFEAEIDEFEKCFKSEDFQEGVKAFLGKRKPVFNK